MEVTDERLSKLPKWAQYYIDHLKSEIDSLEEEVCYISGELSTYECNCTCDCNN